MAPTSSPYAFFRASAWNSVVAEPIGIRQCLRMAPKRTLSIRSTSQGNLSKETK
ncbi:hypothetical protein [Prochlorococcus marinus]|uniref:hypothetical protein n=1 Tax=Prochlorococcus marinus TaxID=1219 RepID=UPI00187CEE13|nr:hypothetical protein [Prochlorococcus marinus]